MPSLFHVFLCLVSRLPYLANPTLLFVQGEGVQHPYAPHLVRAAPPGVHDLSQHSHPVAGTQYVHNVMYQYLRAQAAHGESLLPYHLANASASGGVVPPPRSPVVPKIEPDPEEAVAGRGSAPPGSSPPLELRRPASTTTITTALSLQSPHALDRATDSPQVATVYRMPHFGAAAAAAAASRYYPGDEPPPAHGAHGALIHTVAARAVPAHALHSTAAPGATVTVPVPMKHSPASSESSSTVSLVRPALSTPPLSNQGPPQHDSLMMLLQVGVETFRCVGSYKLLLRRTLTLSISSVPALPGHVARTFSSEERSGGRPDALRLR